MTSPQYILRKRLDAVLDEYAACMNREDRKAINDCIDELVKLDGPTWLEAVAIAKRLTPQQLSDHHTGNGAS